MKLSRKFLSDYIDIDDIETKKLAEDMTSIGNEYDACGKLINATNLVIGEVIECTNHPNSDHLHLCKVNIGDEVLPIVCGAPNVRVGLKTIVAKVGAKLPGGEIKEGVIRGEKSMGMLCSIEELGLEHKYLKEEDINGICELNDDAKVGEDPLKYLNLDDEVIDFELTSNRGDLLSIMGMSYEIGALYNRNVKEISSNYPEVKMPINFDIEVKTNKCPLFLARKVMNVKIMDSPDFIQKRLIASGIRPINNVVDISNYVMLETGQPLHFYDADKLGNKIIVRDALDSEELVTLDNIKRNLTKDDIVISNETSAIGLAGVMGGLSTEVDENTKNVLVESAIFDPVSVRLTSKKILRSEASLRFEKGLDPNRTYLAMERSMYYLNKYAEGTIVGEMASFDNIDKNEKQIDITINDINGLLGITISHDEILDIFKRFGFKYQEKNNIITVTVPTRRIDISIKEDLIEEVARLYGIDRISGKSPILPIKKGSYNKFIRLIREKLASLGLNETLSYTLIPNSEVHKYSLDEFEEIKLLDPMSDDKSTLRYSIIPSLKMIYDYNSKRNNKDICLFEIGKGFKKTDNYIEERHLGILMSGIYTDSINKEKVDFYYLKGIMEELLDMLGFNNRYSLIKGEVPKEYHPGASGIINVDGNNIGYIGKIHPNESKDDIYVLEMNLDLLEKMHGKKLEYKEISKYPSITKDLAFIFDNNITNEMVINEIKKVGSKYLINVSLFDLYQFDNNKSMAYKLTFNSDENTLTDDIINPILDKIIECINKNLNGELRDK